MIYFLLVLESIIIVAVDLYIVKRINRLENIVLHERQLQL